mmetsp:Transcript_26053/g.29806  ORF Transcript_26053/g.29806 Transcript_26053/m.29806 type:complete len:133 (+) Transcript_26053:120-518(+)
MMKFVSLCFCSLLLVLFVGNTIAFSGSFTGSQLSNNVVSTGTISMEYIPSGISKKKWKEMKEKEKKGKGKDLGKVGITSFKSRSFDSWQKSGGKNLFPVDPRSVKNKKEIPYMQRAGGSADDDDLKKVGFFR